MLSRAKNSDVHHRLHDYIWQLTNDELLTLEVLHWNESISAPVDPNIWKNRAASWLRVGPIVTGHGWKKQSDSDTGASQSFKVKSLSLGP